MTTLSSAADVLRCYSDERRDLTVTQVSLLLEMPKSNASRLLRAMAACGMLEPVGASKRYRPGVAVYEAGRQYRLTSPFAGQIDEAARLVAERVGDKFDAVMVIERDGPYVISVAERRAEGPIYRPAGPRRFAAAAAPGHALLARLGEDAIRALLARPAAGYAPIDGGAYAQLALGLGQARRRGFASLADGRGGVEIAVAIGDPQARKEAAISVLTREDAAISDIAKILHEVCAALAGALKDLSFAPFKAGD